MDIKTTQYQQLAFRTAKQFGDIKLDLIHAAIGAGSEVGELAEAVTGNGNYLEELGDIAWYIALGATVIGATFSDMWENPSKQVFFQRHIDKCTMGDKQYCLMILVAAVGDFQTMVKGIFCYGKKSNPLALKIKLQESLYALLLMADVLHVNWTDIAVHNIEKLKKRYPDKYDDVSGIARADK